MSEIQAVEDEVIRDRTITEWVGQHRYASALTLAFLVVGIVAGPFAFPGLSIVRGIAGGAVFGLFCAMCVVLPQVLD